VPHPFALFAKGWEARMPVARAFEQGADGYRMTGGVIGPRARPLPRTQGAGHPHVVVP
jgi:hypothetical protein